MANTVFEISEVELLDGSSLTIRPLSIKNLRKFNEVIKALQSPDIDEEKALEVFTDAALVCMQQLRPDLADKDVFEDTVDAQTMMRILEKSGGLVVGGNPNLTATDLDLGTI